MSRVQLHKPVKKCIKKAKQASGNRCNTLKFTAKNANTKPSKIINQNFSNITKAIDAIEITYVRSPKHK